MAQILDVHKSGLLTSLQGLLQSSKYHDLTVQCGPDEYKLHRAIVCQRSTFFAAACDGQFKEARTGSITLGYDDPPTVKRMFTYLYTLDYDDHEEAASAMHYMETQFTDEAVPLAPLSNDVNKHINLMNNAVVYAIAEKYGILELKNLALQKFETLLLVLNDISGLAKVIDAVFSTTLSTDTALRNVAVAWCVQHSKAVVQDLDFANLLRAHGDLGLAVLQGTLTHHDTVLSQADQSKHEAMQQANYRLNSQESVHRNEIRSWSDTWERNIGEIDMLLDEIYKLANEMGGPGKKGSHSINRGASEELLELREKLRLLLDNVDAMK